MKPSQERQRLSGDLRVQGEEKSRKGEPGQMNCKRKALNAGKRLAK